MPLLVWMLAMLGLSRMISTPSSLSALMAWLQEKSNSPAWPMDRPPEPMTSTLLSVWLRAVR